MNLPPSLVRPLGLLALSSGLACLAASPEKDALDHIRLGLGGGSGFRSRPVASTDPAAVPTDPRGAALVRRLSELGIRARPAGTARPMAVVSDRAQRQKVALQGLLAGADPDLQIHLRPENGTVRHARGPLFTPGGARLAGANLLQRDTDTARALLARWKELLGVDDPEREFVVAQTGSDGLGGRHLRFHQHWQGLRVWPATLSVHVGGQGQATLLEGAYIPSPIGLATRPRLTATEAIELARATVPGGLVADVDAPRLMVHGPIGSEPRLAWGMQMNRGLTQAWLIFVDALDGRILGRSPRVCDANVAGRGTDLEGVSRPLNVWSGNGTHYLIDTSKRMFKPGSDPVNKPEGTITIADARNKKINELKSSDLFLLTSANPASWDVADGVSAAFNFSET